MWGWAPYPVARGLVRCSTCWWRGPRTCSSSAGRPGSGTPAACSTGSSSSRSGRRQRGQEGSLKIWNYNLHGITSSVWFQPPCYFSHHVITVRPPCDYSLRMIKASVWLQPLYDYSLRDSIASVWLQPTYDYSLHIFYSLHVITAALCFTAFMWLQPPCF